MKCDNCSEEATVFLLDHKRFTRSQLLRMQPGAIMECDDPRTFEKYCKWCWALLSEL